MDARITQSQTPVAEDKILRGAELVLGYPRVGKHVILDRLGSGAMGSVYLAYKVSVSRLEALKFLDAGEESSRDLVGRFKHEAQVMANLESPNIVKVHDVDSWMGRHYLSMELVDGETLHDRVRRLGRLSPNEAATITRDAALGLAAIHEAKIIHRDIKPSNIMTTSRGVVKVSDLGVAKSENTDATFHTGFHTVIGTPQYMAPEQFDGKVAHASDVYAIGLTMRYMIGGRDPVLPGDFTRIMRQVTDGLPDPAEAHPELPEGLVDILRAATHVEMSKRQSHARMLAAALSAWLDANGGPVDLEAASLSTLGDKLPAQELLKAIRTEAEREPMGSDSGIGEMPTILPDHSAVLTSAETADLDAGASQGRTPSPSLPTIVEQSRGSTFLPTIAEQPSKHNGVTPEFLPVDSSGFEHQRPQRTVPSWAMVLLGTAAVLVITTAVILMTGKNDWLWKGSETEQVQAVGDDHSGTPTQIAGTDRSNPVAPANESPDERVPRDTELPVAIGNDGGSARDGASSAKHETPEREGVGPESIAGTGESEDPGDNASKQTEEQRRRATRVASLGERIEKARGEIDSAVSIADPITAAASLAGVLAELDEAAKEAEELGGKESREFQIRIKDHRAGVIEAADRKMRAILPSSPDQRETAALAYVDPVTAEQMIGLAEAGSNDTLRVLIGSLQWYPNSEDAEIAEELAHILEQAHDMAVNAGIERSFYHRGEFKRATKRPEAYIDFARGYKTDPDCMFRIAYLLLDFEGTPWDEFPIDERTLVERLLGDVSTPQKRLTAGLHVLENAIKLKSHRAKRLMGEIIVNEEAQRAVNLMVEAALAGNRLAKEQLSIWQEFNRSRGHTIVPITEQHLRDLAHAGIEL